MSKAWRRLRKCVAFSEKLNFQSPIWGSKVSRFKNRMLCLLWFNEFFPLLQKTEKLVALFHVQIKIGQGCFCICKFLCPFVKKMGAGLPIGRNWPTSFIWRIHRNEWDLLSKSLKIIDKDQIKSEWIHEGTDFPN